MKKLLLREAAKHKLQNRRRKRWQKTVSILACLVVFCTVYALILPALTAEADTYCGKEEHTHTDACYEDKLICGQEEGQEAHHHTDDCYREVEALVCQTPESDGHQHTDACYTEEQVLTCTNTEEGHVHSEFEGCYTTEKKLTCGMEEGEGAHHHTAECYEKKKELICGQEENDGHRHTAECYEKELICGKEEHTHTLACYSNPDADVENGDVWQNTVSSVALTGNWGTDLAAIAQTQTGYTESTANYTVAEDGQTIHGYTRYGAWANDPYRDNWSAQFADFCLSYAGVPTSAVPQNSDCSAWNYTNPDGYTPKTGDLLLLDTDNNGSADHAGIVTTADDSTLTAIVGDADKAVRNNTYNIGNENIKGYVSIPENPALADDNHGEETTETTPAPEVTEEPQETPAPEIIPEAEPTQVPENKADDTANNIEVIPTPTITPETMQEVQLEQKTVTAELYTDSTYATAEQSENAVVVSGNLPENGIVKAFPVNNISVEGMKVLCAWDITIFDAEGNKWEPTEGNTLSVKFQIPDLTEKENKAGEIYYIPDENTNQPEKIESQISDDGVSFEAKHFSIYTLMVADATSGENTSNNSEGVDFKQYITGATAQYKVNGNGEWLNLPDNHTLDKNDSVQFTVNYTLPRGTLKNGNRVITYDLPQSLSKFEGSGYVSALGGAHAGTYSIQNGKISITFNEEYAKKNETGDFLGWLSFDGAAKDVETNNQGNTKIEFKTGVEINVSIQDNVNRKGDINVSKEASVIDYENGIVKYTVTISSQDGTWDNVTLHDVMTNIQLDTSKNIILTKQDNTQQILTMPSNIKDFTLQLDKIAPGKQYVLEYYGKMPEGDFVSKKEAVNNVTVTSKDNHQTKIEHSASVSTTFKDLIKTGTDNKDGTISWNIIINPRKQNIGGWTLEDKIGIQGNQTELTNKQVTINPAVNSNGTLTNSITLPFTFPEGTTDKYTVTYTTDVAAEGTNIVNTAILKPSNEKGWSETVYQWVASTNQISKSGMGVEKNSDGTTLTLKWKVQIKPSKDINNDTWTFKDELQNGQWFTDEQYNAIQSSWGEKLGSDNFTIAKIMSSDNTKCIGYTLQSTQALNKDSTIIIEYNSTVDVPENETTYNNKAYFRTSEATGQNTYKPNVPPVPSNPKVKKMDSDAPEGGENTEHDYYKQNGFINWKIEVSQFEQKENASGDIIITENLPDNVTLSELKVGSYNYFNGVTFGANDWSGGSENSVTKNTYLWGSSLYNSSKGDYSIRVERNGQTFEIHIPKELTPASNHKIVIDVKVKINENNKWQNREGDKNNDYASFTNSVSVKDIDGTDFGSDSQTQTIKKELNHGVVGKHALEREGNNIPYEITINPEGKDLVRDAKELTLTDEMVYEWYNSSKLKISLIPGSFKIQNANTGESIPDSQYSMKYEEESNLINQWNDGQTKCTNRMTITLPDSTPIKISYTYHVSGVSGQDTKKIINTATLTGVAGGSKDSSTIESFKIANSSSGVKTEGITVFKVDSEHQDWLLSGAVFELYRWDQNQDGQYDWIKDTENSQLVSDKDGKLTISKLTEGVAYKLLEINPPPGYMISDDMKDGYFFYISTEPSQKPENVLQWHKYQEGDYFRYPNVKSSSYVLPETGGIGTNRFTAMGLALMAGSLMCGYVMRRKRREGRRN